ncbi:MAG TPA: 4Fe-4S binding protein [Dehalococcoidia bacterium]|jgi:formate hydrogenlyase subunit 6/NADH:ubiquinone oxidoreductase subunit I
MAVVAIDLAGCINCGWCRRVCPTETIKYFSTGHRTHVVEADGCIDCGICTPICPVNVIFPVDDYTPAPEKLSAAKDKAKRFAANQRRMKLDRDAVVARTLARLAERKAVHNA